MTKFTIPVLMNISHDCGVVSRNITHVNEPDYSIVHKNVRSNAHMYTVKRTCTHSQ